MDNYNEEIRNLKYLRQCSEDAFCTVVPIWFISLLISVFGLVSVIFAITTGILIWKALAISMIIIGYITTVIFSIVASHFKGETDLLDQEIDRIMWKHMNNSN